MSRGHSIFILVHRDLNQICCTSSNDQEWCFTIFFICFHSFSHLLPKPQYRSLSSKPILQHSPLSHLRILQTPTTCFHSATFTWNEGWRHYLCFTCIWGCGQLALLQVPYKHLKSAIWEVRNIPVMTCEKRIWSALRDTQFCRALVYTIEYILNYKYFLSSYTPCYLTSDLYNEGSRVLCCPSLGFKCSLTTGGGWYGARPAWNTHAGRISIDCPHTSNDSGFLEFMINLVGIGNFFF